MKHASQYMVFRSIFTCWVLRISHHETFKPETVRYTWHGRRWCELLRIEVSRHKIIPNHSEFPKSSKAPNQEVKPNNEWSSSAWNWSQGNLNTSIQWSAFGKAALSFHQAMLNKSRLYSLNFHLQTRRLAPQSHSLTGSYTFYIE